MSIVDAPPPGIVPHNERQVFVVDDDSHFRGFITKALGSAGFVSHEFARISEIEAALTRCTPRIILLELSLPESDAIEVMRSLAEARFPGYILLMSGHDKATLQDVHDVGLRYGLKMLPVLKKPFRLQDLKDSVTRVPQAPAFPADQTDAITALQNNWLDLWYQPKIDLKTMMVCGAEALIRLRHPTQGVLLPPAFLPAPGDADYLPITDFIARRALSDWSNFAVERITVPLAINIPASVLQNVDFVTKIRRHLPDHPKFPGLIFEITEDDAIQDQVLVREIATQLKLYNIRMALDDFGTGHSTLSRLDDLPFSELKLDRKFVHGCATDERKYTMCRHVVELARHYDITAVAEGVETVADLKVLIDLGYDAAQGFYFSKPMEKNEFVRKLLARAASGSAD
jgi:EAL domain-containing protein (putative c-di-GMP-specific phosphodiesterase class I)